MPGLSPQETPVRKVLVADDSRLQVRILSTMLKRWGFEVLTAETGTKALEICTKEQPDLVLSDWMMPGMDGLELCRRFRDLPYEGYGYFILLTSKSEKGEIAEGLDAGADDFLTKPVNAHELRARINAGARILGMQRQMTEQNRIVSQTLAELQEIHAAIDKDLRQARTIQQSLVPERDRVFGHSRVSLLLETCGHVGGDLVGMFSPGDDQLGFYNIDVSGHGITSAMVTARVAGYLSTVFPDQNVALQLRADHGYALRPPQDTAHKLNERFASDPGVAEYLTMAYVAGDLRSGQMRLVQAGHPPPLLLRAKGAVEFIGNGGLPIGLVEEAQFEQVDFVMQTGDQLLLYSDGFTEAVMKDGRMLEQDGLVEIFRKCAARARGPELLADMYWRLTAGMQGEGQLDDDVSAALLEFGSVQVK